MSSEQINGYTVAYEQEELFFPVWSTGLIAFVLGWAALARDVPILWLVALIPAAGFYYNLPLLETGKPRLGAGQYGLFLEGLGLLQWRAIDAVDIVENEFRGTLYRDLEIALKVPVEAALILDWRDRSPVRRFMRLPWSWKARGIIRIPLDVLDKPPREVHAAVVRMWRFYRGH
ncbi:MAG: hypothetical protein KDJ17_07690 [Hyphomicrobiaceae bacterium]|nr:hypothetical protein [Hyphomicrobiaceae bacterium]